MRTLTVYTGGRLVDVDAAEVLGYGSLEALTAGDLLAGIPNREAIMADLWAAANRPQAEIDAEIAEALAQHRAAMAAEEAAQPKPEGADEEAADD